VAAGGRRWYVEDDEGDFESRMSRMARMARDEGGRRRGLFVEISGGRDALQPMGIGVDGIT
jgi:hypothetical protein